MAEIVSQYRIEVKQAVDALNQVAQATDSSAKKSEDLGKKTEQAGQKANKAAINFTNLGKQILSAFGVTAGVVTFVNALKNAVMITANFEAQMSKVRAVSGATADQMAKLEKSAKQLGATTRFTATQVGQLQEEYARLGFTTTEILAATEATLSLAAATGSTLAEAAQVAGATVRGFGLDASETGRVTDVMALSFSRSALSMSDFAEAMKLVAPIARAANIPIETTTSLLGKLADSGLRGSIAGTALKNLLSQLSNENSDLAREIGFGVKNSEDLFRAFDELAKKNIDLTAATELTDERSKAAFITLINGADAARQLSGELDGAAGSAKTMADIMTDNLSGSLVLLSSAYEGFILQLNESNGILKSTVDALSSGLSRFTEAMKLAEGTSFRSIDIALALIFNNKELAKAKEEAAKQTAELTKATVSENEATTEQVVQKERQVRSIATLSEELKTLKEQFENAEVGGKNFRDIAAKIEAKTLELARAIALVSTDTIDEDTDTPQQTAFNSLMNYKEKREKEQYEERKKQREEFDEWLKNKTDAELDALLQSNLDAEAIRRDSLQRSRDEFVTYVQSVVSLINIISQAQRQASEYQLSLIQSQFEQGIISQEEYDRKRREIMREQAKDEKEMQLISAIMATAAAIVEALPNIPLSIIAGVLGAAQVAVIASQPIPQFAEGGWVDGRGMIQGRAHAQGGVKLEAEGGEFIVNRAASAKNAALIEAINKGMGEAYIMRKWVAPAVDAALLNGWQDVGKSADLNGLTATLKDHNIIRAMDRNRETTAYGFKLLADKLNKRTPKRGGYA